jgi:hypothetical protein
MQKSSLSYIIYEVLLQIRKDKMEKEELEQQLSKVLTLLNEVKTHKHGIRPEDPVDEARELLKKIILELKKEKK